jgi:hypothetical protein
MFPRGSDGESHARAPIAAKIVWREPSGEAKQKQPREDRSTDLVDDELGLRHRPGRLRRAS